MAIEIPKPRPGYVYGEASAKATHPSNVRAFQKIGYQKVDAKTAIKEMGFDDRNLADGGYIDKLNNAVTDGSSVLMECPVETYLNWRKQRDETILQKGRRLESDSKEQLDRTVEDYRHAVET
jgi:hypothetical protein